MPIRILSVEDHPVFREGLCTIIRSQADMELVGQATNAAEAIVEFRRCLPAITLMDLRLPGANGTDALISIRGEFPNARIIVLTTSDGDVEIRRALAAGAAAYVLKSTPKDELLAVIRSVHAGRRHVPPEVASRRSTTATRRSPSARWTSCVSFAMAVRTRRSQPASRLPKPLLTFTSRIWWANCRLMIGRMQWLSLFGAEF